MGLSLEVSIGIPLRVESHLEKCKNGIVPVPEEYSFYILLQFNCGTQAYSVQSLLNVIIKSMYPMCPSNPPQSRYE